MAYRKTRTLVDEEIEAGIAAAGSLIAYARLKGVTPSLVSQRLSRVRIARGESEPWDLSWDDKLRFQPTRAQILKLLASDGADVCRERWGERPSYLLQRARA